MARQHRKDDTDPATPFVFEEPGTRLARIHHLLFEEIDRLFRLEVSDPRLEYVTPVGVHLSPDLRNAKVLYAVREPRGRRPPPGEKDIRTGLERVTPFIRARVAEALALKRIPDLHFHRDRMAEASLRAEAVLQAERLAPKPKE